MFIAAITYAMVLPIAVFLAVACIAWMVIDLSDGKSENVEQRLDMLSDSRNRQRQKQGNQTSMAKLSKVIEDVAPTLSKPLTPQTQLEASKLNARLVEAGFRNEFAWMTFLSIKVIFALTVLTLTGGIGVFLGGFDNGVLLKAVLGGGIGFYAPELVLNYLVNKRKKALFLGLPDALDLLVVCVEAGLGLDQAFRKVAEEMRSAYRVLSEELSLSNLHLQMGRARNEVLQDLGNRTGVDDLRSLASLLIQADKFGSSVAQALRVQSDSMRIRRQQIAEEKAAKTAVKLIIPLVVFIFPGVFVVLVGPAAIQMVTEMFPAMQGK